MEPRPAATSLRSPASDGGAVFLRDIEDLHDADLDLILADRLAESADALRAAVAAAVAHDVARPEALRAHVFRASAPRLVG